MSCRPKILVEGDGFNIAQCPGCRRIGFYYQNILAGFNTDEFMAFIKAYSKVDFERNCVRFMHQDQIILNTCHADIQFTFNSKEFNLLLQKLQQAKVILDTNRILES